MLLVNIKNLQNLFYFHFMLNTTGYYDMGQNTVNSLRQLHGNQNIGQGVNSIIETEIR